MVSQAWSALAFVGQRDAPLADRVASCRAAVASASAAGNGLPRKVAQHMKVAAFEWAVQQLARAEKGDAQLPTLAALWEVVDALGGDAQVRTLRQRCGEAVGRGSGGGGVRSHAPPKSLLAQVAQSAQVPPSLLAAASHTSRLSARDASAEALRPCACALSRAASLRAFQPSREQAAAACAAVLVHVADARSAPPELLVAHRGLALALLEVLHACARADPSPRKVWDVAVPRLLESSLPLMFEGVKGWRAKGLGLG